jgi:hypothetical protein
MKRGFCRQILENIQISDFMKMRPVGAQVFHTDGQTHRHTEQRTDGWTDRHDKANSRFSQVCELAQNHILMEWNAYIKRLRDNSACEVSDTFCDSRFAV